MITAAKSAFFFFCFLLLQSVAHSDECKLGEAHCLDGSKYQFCQYWGPSIGTKWATGNCNKQLCNTAAVFQVNICIDPEKPGAEQPGGAISADACGDDVKYQGKIVCTSNVNGKGEGYQTCFCATAADGTSKCSLSTIWPCGDGQICNKSASGQANACISAPATGSGGASVDTDQDGLSDSEEGKYGTKPNVADTDSDGSSDGEEVKKGTNPLVSEAAIIAAVSQLIIDDESKTEDTKQGLYGYPASVIISIPAMTSDQDKDGIMDLVDNCPKVANKDQKDSNKNGIGDACEFKFVWSWTALSKYFKWACWFMVPKPDWCK